MKELRDQKWEITYLYKMMHFTYFLANIISPNTQNHSILMCLSQLGQFGWLFSYQYIFWKQFRMKTVRTLNSMFTANQNQRSNYRHTTQWLYFIQEDTFAQLIDCNSRNYGGQIAQVLCPSPGQHLPSSRGTKNSWSFAISCKSEVAKGMYILQSLWISINELQSWSLDIWLYLLTDLFTTNSLSEIGWHRLEGAKGLFLKTLSTNYCFW